MDALRSAAYHARMTLRILLVALIGCTSAKPPRGVVLVIGDGMGPGQVELLLRAHPDGALAEMLRDGEIGLVDTTPFGALVTDSAAGGTALATGVQTRPRMLSVDPDGRRVETLLEAATRDGLATGVVTTEDLTDATPAAFLAHDVDRNDSAAIAAQELAAPPTIASGGGAKWLRHPPESMQLVADGALPYRTRGARPSLASPTTKALDAVSRNPNGFVLVVEGALIDNACHEHLAPELLGELLDLDDALAVLLPRARAGEILLVVTADHETGGFGLQFRELAEPPPAVKLASGAVWEPTADFGSPSVLDDLRRGNSSPTVVWATPAHTAALVPLVAAGPGASAFAGFYEQRQIGRLLRASIGGR